MEFGKTNYDCIIIGAGIIGLATAHEILNTFPKWNVLILEKEKEIAFHQTGHNSGVIHSGIYYKPGSFKAKNCFEGRKLLINFALKHQIPFDLCGKLIVATDESELENLKAIYRKGKKNGLSGIKLIGQNEIREIEPFCNGIQAIQVPEAGIINYQTVAKKLAEELKSKGASIKLNTSVKSIAFSKNTHKVNCNNSTYSSNYLVSCIGLQADKLPEQAPAKIIPFRGDYYRLKPSALHKVKHLIYPVPNPQFPFLGVHFTRMLNGETECGPNAVFNFSREGYSKMSFSLSDSIDSLSYPPTWKFFAKHWKYGLKEYHRAWSKKQFLLSLQKLIPSLKSNDIEPARAGIRAMALSPQAEMLDDFCLHWSNEALHVINAPSPAATASLAIAKQIVDQLILKFKLDYS